MTFVRHTKKRWGIDTYEKIGSLIAAEIRLKEIVEFSKYAKNKYVLDVGCGDKPYEGILKEQAAFYIGIDVPWSYHDVAKANIFSSADCLPFSDNQFDVIFCTEVLEHLPDTSLALKEFYRVCKPNGYLFLSVPFLHGIHESPHDYYRFTRYGLKYVIEMSGFKPISINPIGEMIAVNITFLVQLLIKVSRAISKVLKIDLIRNLILNTFFIFFAYLPQKLYLRFYFCACASSNSLLNRLFKKASFCCLGYVLIARKTDNICNNK